MKACVLETPAPVDSRPLRLRDVPVPTPRDDEPLVRVSACGICRTDLHVVEGELPACLSPVIPGHQIVGRVAALGARVEGFDEGQRVGVAWLNRTCGVCRFCGAGRENLCESPQFTDWTVNGGFAEYAVAPAAFTYPLPEGFGGTQAAPLLCAGIIGYRALRLTGIGEREGGWAGARLGIYGFGAAGHMCIQLARARGAEIYVATRSRATSGAGFGAGGHVGRGRGGRASGETRCGDNLRAGGQACAVALRALDKGGVPVLGGIHMSDIPAFPYRLIYGERAVRSVANNTRDDGVSFSAKRPAFPSARIPKLFRWSVRTTPSSRSKVTPSKARACSWWSKEERG